MWNVPWWVMRQIYAQRLNALHLKFIDGADLGDLYLWGHLHELRLLVDLIALSCPEERRAVITILKNHRSHGYNDGTNRYRVKRAFDWLFIYIVFWSNLDLCYLLWNSGYKAGLQAADHFLDPLLTETICEKSVVQLSSLYVWSIEHDMSLPKRHLSPW